MSENNKWIAISGGSKGIGYAILRNCISEGYKVAMCYSPDEIDFDYKHENLRVDKISVTNYYKLINWIKNIELDWGNCWGVVSNAGIGGASSVITLSDDLWDKVLEVNLNGTFYFIKSVLPSLLKQNKGRIIAISSIGSRLCHKNASHYCAAKAAIETFITVLSKEVGTKILVNSISPGLIETDLLKNSKNQSILMEQLKEIPLRRFGCPEEIGNLVSFLLSEKNSYITGENITISGGL